MNMIEKVAITLCETRTWPGAWQQANDVEKDACRFEAKAVLETVRDDLVKTKDLEWNDDPCPAAESAFGHYVINERYAHVELLIGYGRSMMTSLCRLQLKRGATLDDLKATAQTDYQDRITSALAQ